MAPCGFRIKRKWTEINLASWIHVTFHFTLYFIYSLLILACLLTVGVFFSVCPILSGCFHVDSNFEVPEVATYTFSIQVRCLGKESTMKQYWRTWFGSFSLNIWMQRGQNLPRSNLFATETDPVFASLCLFGNDLWGMTFSICMMAFCGSLQESNDI